MHELSIAQEILRIVEAEQARHGFQKVETIQLRVGALSGVDSESLRFSFEVIRQNTCAAEANLDIETEPMNLVCKQCGSILPGERGPTACDKCGSTEIKFDATTEVDIIALEVA